MFIHRNLQAFTEDTPLVLNTEELMFPWGKRERREEARYHVPQNKTLPVGVARQDSTWTIGQLINLSQHGAKFYLETVLQFYETVTFGFVLPSLNIEMSMKSTIIWTKATSDDRWMVGCSFDEAIPNAVLDQLGSAGFIDRRRHSRIAASVPGMARSQLNTAFVPVTITDYSVGGFRMESDVPHELSQTVNVQFATDASVFGVVKWKSERGPKYVYGCEFIRDSTEGRSAKVIGRFCNVPMKSVQEGVTRYAETLPRQGVLK